MIWLRETKDTAGPIEICRVLSATKKIPFERYRFNQRVQEPGESYDQYPTALRMVADGCDFHTITPDEILRDRLVFGMTVIIYIMAVLTMKVLAI